MDIEPSPRWKPMSVLKVQEKGKRAWSDQLVLLRTAICLMILLIFVVIGCTVHLSSRIGDAEYAADQAGEEANSVSTKVEELSDRVSSLDSRIRY